MLEIPPFVEAPSVKDKVARTLRETNDVRKQLSGLTGLRLVVLEEPIMALAVPPSPRIQTVSVVHNVKEGSPNTIIIVVTSTYSLSYRTRIAGFRYVVSGLCTSSPEFPSITVPPQGFCRLPNGSANPT